MIAGFHHLVNYHHDYMNGVDALECAYNAHATENPAFNSDAMEPRTYKEAMVRPDATQWHEAALEELNNVTKAGVFERMHILDNCKAIGSRWVFKIKRKADGSVEHYKARLVAQGFSQRPGFDYNETFAPTPRWAALRAIFALAATQDLHLESIDILAAFLDGDLEDEVYM